MIYGLLFGGFLLALAIIIWPIILWPLRHYGNSPEQRDAPSENMNVYKAQLRELETDIHAGLLSDGEAVSAQLEIERRILRIAKDKNITPALAASSNLMIAIAVLILLACVGFYLTRGMPAMEDSPLKQPQQAGDQISPKIMALKKQLLIHPENPQGWRMLGQYYTSQRMRAEAASAFQHWHELAPENIDAAITFGESLIMLANGRVGPAASLMMRRAQQIQPRHPAVQHYQALEIYQAGEVSQALAQWQALEAHSAPDAPWLGQLRMWIGRAQRDLGITTSQKSSPLPSISPEQRQAVSEMSADDQAAMIRSMVARLQEKMDKNPQNSDGWLQLIRAYRVLGDKENAIKALKQAEKHASDDMKEALKKQRESLER